MGSKHVETSTKTIVRHYYTTMGKAYRVYQMRHIVAAWAMTMVLCLPLEAAQLVYLTSP